MEQRADPVHARICTRASTATWKWSTVAVRRECMSGNDAAAEIWDQLYRAEREDSNLSNGRGAGTNFHRRRIMMVELRRNTRHTLLVSAPRSGLGGSETRGLIRVHRSTRWRW